MGRTEPPACRESLSAPRALGLGFRCNLFALVDEPPAGCDSVTALFSRRAARFCTAPTLGQQGRPARAAMHAAGPQLTIARGNDSLTS